MIVGKGYQDMFRDILVAYAEAGGEICNKEALELVADKQKLSEDDRNQMCNIHLTMENNMFYGRMRLAAAGMLSTRKKGLGLWQITEFGLETLRTGPQRIDIKYLMTIPAYVEWVIRTHHKPAKPSNRLVKDRSPVSVDCEMESAPKAAADSDQGGNRTECGIHAEMLKEIRALPFDAFERLGAKVLRRQYRCVFTKIGGHSRDGGLDGEGQVISDLGSQRFGIQVKQQKTVVGSSQMRDFSGALSDKGAQVGFFITSSRFSRPASELACRRPQTILIDGKLLCKTMIKLKEGTRSERCVDKHYFEKLRRVS